MPSPRVRLARAKNPGRRARIREARRRFGPSTFKKILSENTFADGPVFHRRADSKFRIRYYG
jgi:hypothetical protein